MMHRKLFIGLIVLAALVSGCQFTALKDTISKPPREAFVPLRLGEIKPEGWMRTQLERDLVSGYQGHLDVLLRDPKTGEPHLSPENNDFVTRAQNKKFKIDDQGRCVPKTEYTWWPGEMIGEWQDGLIRAAFLTGEPNAKKKAERFVEDMLKSQDEDGYIGIYPKGGRYHFAISDGELWTQRCAMLGLLAYYEFTDREDVLDAVQRAVKLTLKQYGPKQRYFHNPQQESNGVAHGLMFVDILDWLYRLTGDDEYRRAAVSLYRDDFCTSETVRNADLQLKRLLDPENPLGGHGPDVMGMLRVPLMCYYMTGNKTYLRAWESGIHKTEPQLGVGGSPLTGRHEEISTTYRKPYLPYEYCSTFFLMHSLTWGIQKTGDPHYSDMFERTLFNAAQGARFANGKAVTYYSKDERLWVRQHAREGSDCNPRYLYTAAYYPNCCLNSAARAYPYAISSMWMRSQDADGDGLAATLYGPCRVSTKIQNAAVTVVEKTAYPFTYDIDFVIETDRAVEFPIRLRVPQWSAEPTVVADGATVTRDERGYLVVSKRWKTGDTIQLKLHPSIQGCPAVDGTTALSYGPLVFSFPIPEKAEITHRFPHAEAVGLKGYYGYQYDPVDLSYARRKREWNTAKESFGFEVVKNEDADLLYPWEQTPIKLRGDMVGKDGIAEPVVLKPMGSTILRWTCFPKVSD